MNTKASKAPKAGRASPDQPNPEETLTALDVAQPHSSSPRGPETDPDAAFTIILERGEAEKLSPKANGKIFFQLARNGEDQSNYLRITGNSGGGLHTKEWIKIATVIDTLKPLAGTLFRSTALKGCMIGKSSNNASFLAAVLRSPEIGLIAPSGEKPFLHVLAEDFDNRAKEAMNRLP